MVALKRSKSNYWHSPAVIQFKVFRHFTFLPVI